MKRITAGFTFVELMVVISIAAILFSLASVTYSNVTKNSRDARRKVDLESIRQALELCRSSFGTYPASVVGGSDITCGTSTYLSVVPKDPKTALDYTYSPDTSTYATYTLTATLENCTNNCTYEIKNP